MLRSTHLIRHLLNRTSRRYSSYNNMESNARIQRNNILLISGTSLLGGILIYEGLNEFQYFGASIRFIRSLKIGLLISIDYSYSLKNLTPGTEEYEKKCKEVHQRSANRLLQGCLKNGGLYIKIGQGVSAINHILPSEYTDTLKTLENECLHRSKSEVRKVFSEEFNKQPEEIFTEFNFEPVAAASLAQVFKGKTRDDEEVAIKVQYRDLRKRFNSDFETILFIQGLVKLVHKNYAFDWILKDLRSQLEEELDFTNEGDNAERCAKELSKFKFIYVPEVHWKYTTKRIITTEWINGYKITDLNSIRDAKIDLSDIDRKLFTAFSEQIFNTGFVHADPHPGNLFIRKDTNGDVQLVIIDHGLYQYIPKHVRQPLCKFWEAIILNDTKGMKTNARKLDVDDHDKFAEILLQMPLKVNDFKIKTRLSDDDIEYMQQIAKHRFDLIMNTLKQMPRDMLFVIRNLNTIRAISRNHGDPVDRPRFMAKYAHQCVSDTTNSFITRPIKICRNLWFEFKLFKLFMQNWIIQKYFRLLHKMGRAPDMTIVLHQDYEYA